MKQLTRTRHPASCRQKGQIPDLRIRGAALPPVAESRGHGAAQLGGGQGLRATQAVPESESKPGTKMVYQGPCFKTQEGGLSYLWLGLALTNLHLPGFDCGSPRFNHPRVQTANKTKRASITTVALPKQLHHQSLGQPLFSWWMKSRE